MEQDFMDKVLYLRYAVDLIRASRQNASDPPLESLAITSYFDHQEQDTLRTFLKQVAATYEPLALARDLVTWKRTKTMLAVGETLAGALIFLGYAIDAPFLTQIGITQAVGLPTCVLYDFCTRPSARRLDARVEELRREAIFRLDGNGSVH